MTSVISFIIVLGVLIFFHELGHFLVARLFGVGVEKFSLGFGPRLIGKKVGITDYRISAIPLGGYVKMVGEEPDAEIDPKDIPVSFTHKHVIKRIFIVAAGPFFNMLLAAIIFFGIFQVSGVYELKPSIGKIEEGSPAERAGIKPGDAIVSVQNEMVVTWEDMARLISNSNGSTLSVQVKRQEEIIGLEVTPALREDQNLFGEPITRYVIGVTSSGDFINRHLSLPDAFVESIEQTWRITTLTVTSVWKLIQGKISAKTLGGPLMIAELAGEQAREGAANLVFFIALLSINLAILNILPIPVLDGGHLLFFLIELVIGKPVSTRVREVAQQAGVFILILLTIFVFYNDINRILFKN
jgi:regulator of sigma E protease